MGLGSAGKYGPKPQFERERLLTGSPFVSLVANRAEHVNVRAKCRRGPRNGRQHDARVHGALHRTRAGLALPGFAGGRSEVFGSNVSHIHPNTSQKSKA